MNDYKDWTPRELLVELHSKFEALAIFFADLRDDPAAALLLRRSARTIEALTTAIEAPPALATRVASLTSSIRDLRPGTPLGATQWSVLQRHHRQCTSALREFDPRLAPRCIPPQTTISDTGDYRVAA